MPNHVINRVTIRGEEAAVAAALADLIDERDPEAEVDFGRLVPMPAELDVEDRSDAQIAFEALHGDWRRVAAYAWVPEAARESREALVGFLREQYGEEAFRLAERYRDNIARHGHATWYGWCVEHWGTKWNAYHSEVTAREPGLASVEFQTAWAEPEPVVTRLSAKHPRVEVLHRFADEFLNFCGWRRYLRGRVVERASGPGSWLAELGFTAGQIAEAAEAEAL